MTSRTKKVERGARRRTAITRVLDSFRAQCALADSEQGSQRTRSLAGIRNRVRSPHVSEAEDPRFNAVGTDRLVARTSDAEQHRMVALVSCRRWSPTSTQVAHRCQPHANASSNPSRLLFFGSLLPHDARFLRGTLSCTQRTASRRPSRHQ